MRFAENGLYSTQSMFEALISINVIFLSCIVNSSLDFSDI